MDPALMAGEVQSLSGEDVVGNRSEPSQERVLQKLRAGDEPGLTEMLRHLDAGEGGDPDADSLASLCQLGLYLLYEQSHRYAEADAILERMLQRVQPLVVLPKALARAMDNVLVDLIAHADSPRRSEALERMRGLLKGTSRKGSRAIEHDRELAAGYIGLVLGVSRSLKRAGDIARAKVCCREILVASEVIFGTQSGEVGEILTELAVLHMDANDAVEADRLFARACDVYRTCLPRLPRRLSWTLDCWARALMERGLVDLAQPFLEEALAAAEEDTDPENPDVAVAAADLADVYFRRGAMDAAASIAKRAILLLDRNGLASTPEYADTLYVLGSISYNEGEYTRAAEAAAKAVETYASIEEPTTYIGTSLAFASRILACAQSRLGHHREATESLRRAVVIYDTITGANDPGVAVLLEELGGCYDKEGRTGEAERAYRRSMTIFERTEGEGSLKVAEVLDALACVVEKNGDLAEADRLFRRSHGIRVKLLGREHPLVAESLSHLRRIKRGGIGDV